MAEGGVSIPLSAQATAVELAALGLEHRLEIVTDGRKWPAHDIEQKLALLGKLQAAAVTLHALAQYPDEVREALRQAKQRASETQKMGATHAIASEHNGHETDAARAEEGAARPDQ